MESIVTLTNAPHGFGGKAGHLSALLARGFEVPVGFLIAPDAPQASISISATIPSLAVVMAVSTVWALLDDKGRASTFALARSEG